MSGTTLTLAALIFIAFAYETSELTWRDLSDKFCAVQDRIAHSTLYKAVHGLAKSLLDQSQKIKEGIQKLYAAFLPQGENSLPGRPQMKALYNHTRERETAIHHLLLPLWGSCLSEALFVKAFYDYLKPLRIILSTLDPPVLKLYNK